MASAVRVVNLAALTESDIRDDELVVRTPTEDFRIRRRTGPNRKPSYQVWHALAWGQHPLTLTQWRPCANLAAAVQLMKRYS